MQVQFKAERFLATFLVITGLFIPILAQSNDQIANIIIHSSNSMQSPQVMMASTQESLSPPANNKSRNTPIPSKVKSTNKKGMIAFFAIAIAFNIILGGLLFFWVIRQWRLRSIPSRDQGH
jgi:hypothetical protein